MNMQNKKLEQALPTDAYGAVSDSSHPPSTTMPPPMAWQPNYYYMGNQPYAYPWYAMPQQHQTPPQQPHHHSPPPDGDDPPHSGIPISPRNHPLPLQGPGTPTPAQTVPVTNPLHLPPTTPHSKANILAPLPSALATARIIDDLGCIPYPEGIKSPRIELNINAKGSKFIYDRDFLLQFMSICKEKPESLPSLDAIGLEPSDQSSYPVSRGGSGRYRQSSGPVPPQRQNSTGLGFNPHRHMLSSNDPDSPDVVDRKVKGLLNKLAMGNFDSISDQIIALVNKSEKKKDARTLIQVIRLVFEGAADEATSEVYARLCRKMMEQISAKVQDDGIKNSKGKPIAGDQLFRKYLLNRCQEDFERGWVTKEATAAAAASKAIEDQAAKAAAEKKGDGEEKIAFYSEDYYAVQKAKCQGLGLIKFIGELFKLQMLTERIMHECVKKLLGNVENPEEEEIESLCKLLTTVGQLLDTSKARAHMDVYFSRMKELTKSPNVSSRMQFMLQDVLELRERKWVSRNAVVASTQHQMSMSRGGSRRSRERGEIYQVGADGWGVAGRNSAPRPQPEAGDLSRFGQIRGAPLTFGPQSSVYAGRKDKQESVQLKNPFSCTFCMNDTYSEATSEEMLPRKRLVLGPRSKPVKGQENAPTTAESEGSSDEEVTAEPEPVEMSDKDAKKKIEEDIKEFSAVRNLDEAEVYFTQLPAKHYPLLVDKLISFAVESKEADAQLVSQLFSRASTKNLCTIADFERGFGVVLEFLDDIAIDAPMAFKLMATMMKGPAFDDEQRTRLASKTDSAKLLGLLS